jgi:hypothetical protein
MDAFIVVYSDTCTMIQDIKFFSYAILLTDKFLFSFVQYDKICLF